jgi:hypothetical protein
MKTVTLDILDHKAIDLLKDLQALNIIRIQDIDGNNDYPINSFTKYKGKISSQSIEEIDKQVNDLRNEWD